MASSELSMAQIAEYVKAGQTPPGVKDIDDSPVMRPASTSDTERPRKVRNQSALGNRT